MRRGLQYSVCLSFIHSVCVRSFGACRHLEAPDSVSTVSRRWPPDLKWTRFSDKQLGFENKRVFAYAIEFVHSDTPPSHQWLHIDKATLYLSPCQVDVSSRFAAPLWCLSTCYGPWLPLWCWSSLSPDSVDSRLLDSTCYHHWLPDQLSQLRWVLYIILVPMSMEP